MGFKYKLYVDLTHIGSVEITSNLDYEDFIVDLAHRRFITADNGLTFYPKSFLAVERLY